MSTGTRSLFLSPTDALHGDIGCVARGDVLVAFSKSGGSEELIKLLPFAKVVQLIQPCLFLFHSHKGDRFDIRHLGINDSNIFYVINDQPPSTPKWW